MTRKNEIAFENWWACLLPHERDDLDKKSARRIFYAGFRSGSAGMLKRFVFLIGSRRITVAAPTHAAAKRKAESIFDKRMSDAGNVRPKGGWSIRLAPDNGMSKQ